MRYHDAELILSKAELSLIRQGLFRVLFETINLQSELTACMEKVSVLQVPPTQEDVSSITDRLNDVFTAHSRLTRRKGWLDADE